MATAKQVLVCNVAHYPKLQAEALLFLLSVAPFVIKTEGEESAISMSFETHFDWSWGIY